MQHLMGARRLGGLDMFAETDYRAVLSRFRAAHPRQAQRPDPEARGADTTTEDAP